MEIVYPYKPHNYSTRLLIFYTLPSAATRVYLGASAATTNAFTRTWLITNAVQGTAAASQNGVGVYIYTASLDTASLSRIG